ncbi:hypothetical protein BV372_18960 [Nostoc sp. T09]|uniref:hypothetical protein n=1 Tax=Nostoc sp. T09 TaxID=1932621 RepID=UPI000A3985A9|nr:hypothetical protein [Nostoc sp. T09]OUL32554.1 hypothetical protein BV372_18960 [Nostoc sp. T09]
MALLPRAFQVMPPVGLPPLGLLENFPQPRNGRMVVIIDPGRGDKEPGSIGIGGVAGRILSYIHWQQGDRDFVAKWYASDDDTKF